MVVLSPISAEITWKEHKFWRFFCIVTHFCLKLKILLCNSEFSASTCNVSLHFADIFQSKDFHSFKAE